MKIFLLFLLVRILLMFNLPPYTDESLYIRWGLLMIDNPVFRWGSMMYLERQPLALWLFGFGARIFGNPLIGARLITLMVSVPSFFAFRYICKKLLNENGVQSGLVIFSLTPLFILLQSLALMDGIIMSFAIILFMLLVMYQKKQSTVLLIIMGVILGVLLWIKTTALLLVGIIVISVFLLCLKQKQSIIAGVLRSCIPIIIAGSILIPLFMRPDINSLIGESGHFTLTIRELLRFPFALWAGNVMILLIGLLIYMTPVAVILLFLGIKHIQKDHRILLLLWIFIPMIITLLTGKLFRVRYFAFTLPFAIPFIAASGKSKILRYVLYGSLAIASGILVFSPRTFFALFPGSVPRLMEHEYAYSWTAGYGVRDAVRFIDEQLKNDDTTLFLAVADSTGNPSDFILATYFYHPKVKVIIITTTNETDFRTIEPVTRQAPVYLVTRQGLISSEIQKYLKPIGTFQISNLEEYTGVYQIIF